MARRIVCFLVLFWVTSSSAYAADYVVRVETSDDEVGMVHSYISHAILDITLFNSKGAHKSFLLSPGNHYVDVALGGYWRASVLDEVVTAYTIHGRGKKENHSVMNIWQDRNAFWANSTYYFHVKSDDLGDIQTIGLKTKKTGADSAKILRVKAIDVYKGRRVKSASHHYVFPNSAMAITQTEHKTSVE